MKSFPAAPSIFGLARRLVVALLTIALLNPRIAAACSICYGEPGSPANQGLTWAIAVLGLVVSCVLGGIVTFFVQANRRAAAAPAPDHVSAPDARS